MRRREAAEERERGAERAMQGYNMTCNAAVIRLYGATSVAPAAEGSRSGPARTAGSGR
jgi:hypothetical protein